MSWQDAVFGAGQALFAVALLPSLLGPEKPSPWTSLPTALVLFAFCAAYASLGLRWGAASCAVAATAWLALWVQMMCGRPR